MAHKSQNNDVTLFVDKELTSIVEPDAAILGAIQNPELKRYTLNLQTQHFAAVQDANVATIKSAYAAIYPDGKLSPTVAKKVQAVMESLARLEESASLLSITVVSFCWRILLISESMGHHDSEIMDDGSID
jgi:hypothetical protein